MAETGCGLLLNRCVSEDLAFYYTSALWQEIGVRGAHGTVLTPAHFPLSLTLPLHPYASLLLLSLPSCHLPASISLLTPLTAFCHVLSSSSPAAAPPFPSSLTFSPHLFHLAVISFSSPACALVSSHHVLAATTVGLRPTDTKALMERVAIIFYRLLVVLSDVPNYLNAKLDLVPALWPLLTLIIHFCKKELFSKHWQTNTDTKLLPWQ